MPHAPLFLRIWHPGQIRPQVRELPGQTIMIAGSAASRSNAETISDDGTAGTTLSQDHRRHT
jgi:hypothetical protein